MEYQLLRAKAPQQEQSELMLQMDSGSQVALSMTMVIMRVGELCHQKMMVIVIHRRMKARTTPEIHGMQMEKTLGMPSKMRRTMGKMGKMVKQPWYVTTNTRPTDRPRSRNDPTLLVWD